jgi:hypothetical protein
MGKKIKKLLPKKKKNRGAEQVNKVKALFFSFALGNDCLSDLDDLRKDSLFGEIIKGGVASRTIGDFLRSFGRRDEELLQKFLLEFAFELRMILFPQDKKFILSMDSTPHEHYSKKMEGLGFNYKNLWIELSF